MEHHVIVFDPDPAASAQVRDVLTIEGFLVEQVSAPGPACEAAGRGPYSLALIALTVPPMDRAEFLDRLRARKFPGWIMFCGDPRSPDAATLTRASGHPIVPVPVEAEHLKGLAAQAAAHVESKLAADPSLAGPPPAQPSPAAPPPAAADARPESGATQGPPGTDAPEPAASGGLGSAVTEASLAVEGLSKLSFNLRSTLDRLLEEERRVAKKTADAEARLNSFQQEAQEMLAATNAEVVEARAEAERARAEVAQAQEAARAEAAELRGAVLLTFGSLVTSLPEPTVAINKAGSVVGVSKAMAAVLGQPAQKLIGRPCRDLLAPDLVQLLEAAEKPFEEERELEISTDSGKGTFKVVGFPVQSGKLGLGIKVVFLHPAGGGGRIRPPKGDLRALVEDFKERLFSVRLLTNTITKKSDNEAIRNVAQECTEELDKLVPVVDDMFRSEDEPDAKG